MKKLNARTTIFLSIITSFFIISKAIPISIGELFYIFFGTLFYYFSGWICIAYIYFLITVEVIVNLPLLITAGPEIKQAVFSAYSDPKIVPIVNAIPDYVFVLLFVDMVYFSLTASILVCRGLIKKFHILKRFGGIHS